ncbi:hypothetical protein JHK86_051458 [Glycine max]|nr:hypothetical protein JHK86_051458 [Glycine max]
MLLALRLLLLCVHVGPRQQSQDWLNHGKDITATPAIYGGALYFPSWNGYIYAVKEADGSLIWMKNLLMLTGLNATDGVVPNANSTVSRSTPTVAGDLLIFGTYSPAAIIALKIKTGELVWKITLDDHPEALITMSGTYYNGGYYVGISSLEALMLPDNNNRRGEYAGAAIWGSSPSIDVKRNHVYIGTGNLYSAPLHIRQCRERQNNRTEPTQPDECIEPDNHSNSILALDLDSGKIRWYRQCGGFDIFFLACINASAPNCPPRGLWQDADFGEAPMMLTIYINRTKKDVVVAVQKSGYAWALDRNNGNLMWFTPAGPGGITGGGTWGAATDERRVYTNIANSEAKNFTLAPSNMTTTAGGWVAMNASNGRVLWSTANPTNGPVSVANEVVIAGSTDRMGSIYAFDANNGKILWTYKTGATVYGGMSINNGCIYVGHGYNVFVSSLINNFTGGASLFAFCTVKNLRG